MGNKIEVVGVSKLFRRGGKEIVAMQETNLFIEEGRFVSIIGPSGCGKSTLFNIIAGCGSGNAAHREIWFEGL